MLNNASQTSTYYYQVNPGTDWTASWDFLYNGGGDGYAFSMYQTSNTVNVITGAPSPAYSVKFLRFNNPRPILSTPSGNVTASDTFTGMFPTADVWYTMKVRFISGNIKVYVNDVLEIQTEAPLDSSALVPNTWFGFSAWTGGFALTIRVRNFHLTGNPTPQKHCEMSNSMVLVELFLLLQTQLLLHQGSSSYGGHHLQNHYMLVQLIIMQISELPIQWQEIHRVRFNCFLIPVAVPLLCF